jgi:hypothetical protein
MSDCFKLLQTRTVCGISFVKGIVIMSVKPVRLVKGNVTVNEESGNGNERKRQRFGRENGWRNRHSVNMKKSWSQSKNK